MGDDFTTKIEILRKKSRSLLNQVSHTSKVVENELKKLRKLKTTQFPRNNASDSHQSSTSWRTRNDSSEVHSLLHPPSEDPNAEMTVGRILITSKRPGVSCDPRKPVPGCYCRRAVRYKSPNTVYRPWEPCHYCKIHFEVFEDKVEETEDVLVSPALSSETLQRVQSIDYTPRSEFLRKVQRKVSEQFSDRRSQVFEEISQNSAHFPRKNQQNQQNSEDFSDFSRKNWRNVETSEIVHPSNISEENEEIVENSSNFRQRSRRTEGNGNFSDFSQENHHNEESYENSSYFHRRSKKNPENNLNRQNSSVLSTYSGNHHNRHKKRHSRQESSQDERNSSQNQRNSSHYIEKIHEIELINLENDSTIVDPHAGDLIQVPVEVHQVISPNSSESVEEQRSPTHKSRSFSLQKTSSTNFHQTGRKSRNFRPTSQTLRDFSPEIETILPPKPPQNDRSKPKKTITSINRQKQQQTSKSNTLTQIPSEKSGKNENSREKSANKVIRTLSQRSCQNSDCLVNERRKKSKKSSKCDCCDRCTSHLTISPVKCGLDEKTVELRKFREKNYFDTHQSRHEINSCPSSRSLEQFELNDRLFPESVGRFNREDVVVTMPPCVTSDFKRIHYFPRCIVREDKKTSKKRHKSCPLTGHSVDLGILKPPVPANSLALKYQKGVV